MVVVAVVVLASVGWWFATRSRRSIERVLAADRATYYRHEKEIKGGRAVAVREMVREMKSISLWGCPSEFRVAYVEHCNAWAAVGGRWESNKNQGLFGLVVCGFNAYTGNLKGAALGLLKIGSLNDREQQQALRASWEKVEAISGSYVAR